MESMTSIHNFYHIQHITQVPCFPSYSTHRVESLTFPPSFTDLISFPDHILYDCWVLLTWSLSLTTSSYKLYWPDLFPWPHLHTSFTDLISFPDHIFIRLLSFTDLISFPDHIFIQALLTWSLSLTTSSYEFYWPDLFPWPHLHTSFTDLISFPDHIFIRVLLTWSLSLTTSSYDCWVLLTWSLSLTTSSYKFYWPDLFPWPHLHTSFTDLISFPDHIFIQVLLTWSLSLTTSSYDCWVLLTWSLSLTTSSYKLYWPDLFPWPHLHTSFTDLISFPDHIFIQVLLTWSLSLTTSSYDCWVLLTWSLSLTTSSYELYWPDLFPWPHLHMTAEILSALFPCQLKS